MKYLNRMANGPIKKMKRKEFLQKLKNNEFIRYLEYALRVVRSLIPI